MFLSRRCYVVLYERHITNGMPRYEGDIIHSDARKNHKYIYRVKVDDDKYMYFYTQDELDNYMNRKSGVRRDSEIDKINLQDKDSETKSQKDDYKIGKKLNKKRIKKRTKKRTKNKVNEAAKLGKKAISKIINSQSKQMKSDATNEDLNEKYRLVKELF